MSQEYGAPVPPKSGMPTWAWIIIIPCGCMVLIVPILAAILFPVFAQARERARGVSCLSNMKQQSLGALMYCQDYDEHFPAADKWMDMTAPYVKNETTLHCPTVSQPGSQTFGYSYSQKMSGMALEKIASPNSTPLLYDSSNLSKNATDAVTSLPNPARHAGRNNMSYADGHARFLRPPSGSE